MTKDERIDQLSNRVMELEEQLRLAQKRAADAADQADMYCQCAIESQDWDWLSAKEAAEEQELDFFDIEEMQELYEIAHNKKGQRHG